MTLNYWVQFGLEQSLEAVFGLCYHSATSKGGNKDLNKSAQIMNFTNLFSLEVFQSTPILGHARVLHNAVLSEEGSSIKILIIHLFTC